MFSGATCYICYPLKSLQMAARRCVPSRAIFCRVRAPDNPAGHFFVSGRFDKVFSKIPKISWFGLGNFCRGVPWANSRRNRAPPPRCRVFRFRGMSTSAGRRRNASNMPPSVLCLSVQRMPRLEAGEGGTRYSRLGPDGGVGGKQGFGGASRRTPL